ncbi:MAG: DUF2029 domain-containing protein [Acidobacteriia bacterium]|nr:DUF2029 domain-containing protein [Terriglobia bacterium]
MAPDNGSPKPESGVTARSVRRVRSLVLPAGLAVLVFGILAFVVQPRDRYTSDFYSFWAGARLAGHDVYDAAQAQAIQRSVSPLVSSKRYIRPPFYALALWPLGRLPFHTAYVVWSVLNLAAALGFVWAWRCGPASYVACALFLPLGWSFGIGQDAPLMLLAAAAGARLIERKKELAGGALLALCAIKPHLLLFIPVALLAQRKGRALAGMLGAGSVLYLLSSAAAGLGWPAAFVRAAMENEATIRPRLLGVAGLLARAGGPTWILPGVMACGAAVAYWWARRAAWLPAFAFAVAAGVVFAPRSMAYDGSLFLPLLLLQFSPAAVIAAGAALVTVVTPAGIVAEAASVAILWLARPARAQGWGRLKS